MKKPHSFKRGAADSPQMPQVSNSFIPEEFPEGAFGQELSSDNMSNLDVLKKQLDEKLLDTIPEVQDEP